MSLCVDNESVKEEELRWAGVKHYPPPVSSIWAGSQVSKFCTRSAAFPI